MNLVFELLDQLCVFSCLILW